MSEAKVFIIGVTPDGISGLSPQARRWVEEAEIVFGGKRLLDMFPSLSAEKISIEKNLVEITDSIKSNLGKKRIVVLATGDPGFYGIAGYLAEELGKVRLQIIPNVSSMQVAFARIGESWNDAIFVSAHGRDIKNVVKTVRSVDKVGIFTDDENTPAVIARALIESSISDLRAYVCQDLGTGDEKIVETDLKSLTVMNVSQLNVLILIREQKAREDEYFLAAPGIPDNEFHQRKPKEGLITKQEVRAVSLSKLRLTDESVLWDIGAGSGAVSIEASFFIRKGRIYAVEKNRADADNIRRNMTRFGVNNIEVIEATAPDGLDELPDPYAVFIGGSGGRMKEIIELTCRRLKPGRRIVINVVSLENLNIVMEALRMAGFTSEVVMVNISRGTDILDLTRLEALNPVFIITG
ncbi:precorrin-6y C5,15-methyltransferase (decarboxylating) subunit CbiE [Chloroflexota bacterium]